MTKKQTEENSILLDPEYQPNQLLDRLIAGYNLVNDAGLGRTIKCSAPYISKVRNKKLPIGDSFLIKAHLKLNVSIDAMIRIAGMSKAYGI